MIAWEIPSLGSKNITENRHLQVLSSILNDRVCNLIREDLGGSYSPQAYTDVHSDYDVGFMFLYVEGLPQEMQLFAMALDALVANLTIPAGSITEDDVARAIRPIETIHNQESLLSNEAIPGQAKPHVLEWAQSFDEDFSSIHAAGINTLVQQYLTADKALQITIMPQNDTAF